MSPGPGIKDLVLCFTANSGAGDDRRTGVEEDAAAGGVIDFISGISGCRNEAAFVSVNSRPEAQMVR